MEISNLGSVWADFWGETGKLQKTGTTLHKKTQKLDTTITPQIEPLIASILVHHHQPLYYYFADFESGSVGTRRGLIFFGNWETPKNWNYFTQKTPKLNTTITPQIEPLIASILLIN